jgi:hypothetical protein
LGLLSNCLAVNAKEVGNVITSTKLLRLTSPASQ